MSEDKYPQPEPDDTRPHMIKNFQQSFHSLFISTQNHLGGKWYGRGESFLPQILHSGEYVIKIVPERM